MSGSNRIWGEGEHLPCAQLATPTMQKLQTQTARSFPRKLQIFECDILDFWFKLL